MAKLSASEIQKQIDELIKQKQKVLKNEKANIIASIKKQIEDFEITADELGFKLDKKKSSKKTTLEPKYRGPKGEEWHGGKGPRPKWVKDIEAKGESIEKYLIQPA